MLISYAEFKTYLTSFIDIDMAKILKEITEEYQLTDCERYFDEYKEEDEIKKNLYVAYIYKLLLFLINSFNIFVRARFSIRET